MKLKPNNILENLETIGIKEANLILKEWIINSNEKKVRRKALEILEHIDDEQNFHFYENLFLSDEDCEIQKRSGIILKKNYLKHKKIIQFGPSRGCREMSRFFAKV